MTLLNEQEAANGLACSVALLRKWRQARTGVPFCRIGRAVRYRPEDVEAFIEASLVRTRISDNNEEGEHSSDN